MLYLLSIIIHVIVNKLKIHYIIIMKTLRFIKLLKWYVTQRTYSFYNSCVMHDVYITASYKRSPYLRAGR